MANQITLPVLPLNQNGVQIYVTKMKAADLHRFTRVEQFDNTLSLTHRDQGYQRAAEVSRIKKFAKWLRDSMERGDQVTVPTAVLLSSRDIDLKYQAKDNNVTLNSNNKLFLVDGQHRTEGFRYAIFDKGLEAAAHIEVPVIIVPGMRKEAEMRQFATVNGTQKSVRMDLVNMILTQLSQGEGEDVIRPSERWKVVVSQVVKKLNDDEHGSWHNLIVMPNESAPSIKDRQLDPHKAKVKLVRATSFMTSLKPIYDHFDQLHYRDDLSLDDRAERLFKVLSAYWGAIREINPAVFESPGEYVMLKTPGLFALHQVCKQILGPMHYARRKFDQQNFIEMLDNSSSLKDPEKWDVRGGDFAAYGSMKGFADLARQILEELNESAE